MKAKFIFGLGLAGLLAFSANGQDTADSTAAYNSDCLGLDPKEWRYPEDKNTATEKNAYYTDMLKAENYEEAAKALGWLLENAPDLNPSIYINGFKIYEALGDATEDEEVKYAYYDSALWCYDQRAHFFCDENGELLDRKSFYNFKFYYRDPEKYESIYNMYWQALEVRGVNFNSFNTVPFMTAAVRYYDPIGKIEATDVLDVYDKLTEILETKLQNNALDAEKGEEYQGKLDGLLAGAIPMDVAFIEENFCTKLAEDPTNVSLAKKVVAYSLSNKATENACFIEAAKLVYHSDPTDAMARTIADKHLALDQFDSAVAWYENAIALMEDNVRKSEIYYSIANIHRTKGSYSSARSASLKGIEEDPTNTNHYIMIGDLYQASFQSCKKGQNIVHDRAVFIAAYNWYRKAGNSERMAQAKAQFPSTEEIFQYNMAEGQNYTVGCWINETVSIQARN